MHDPLFGLETELAFSAWAKSRGRSTLPRGRMIQRLFRLARERICSLPDPDAPGIFLANGSRFYLDCGEHPEFCTPECRTPAELVRWQLAGERLLADLIAELEKEYSSASVALFRCNVDYSGSHSVWGCHESYLYENNGGKMPTHLIPHLVTRLVYTGAGGFDSLKSDLEFVLSPRVPHVTHTIGPAGSPERGIYHAKNEPLCRGGYSRLHLTCGESLSSQLSNYLKVGTTALVVRLIDAGVSTGNRLAFDSPREAMREFASDPSCRKRQPLKDGRRMTAIEVQREYLEMVERHIDADFMPAWAAEVCRRWREVLDALHTDPDSLSTRLDWSIKHALFRERTNRWSTPLRDLTFGSRKAAELCEIDTLFGELSERGLFHCLDRAGALDHHIPELGSVEEAMSTAPPGGRAEARGKAIRELHEESSRYQATWGGIIDSDRSRFLAMWDPFDASPSWEEREELVRPARRARRTRTSSRTPNSGVERGIRYYDHMDVPRAVAELDTVIRETAAAADLDGEALARFWCASAHAEAGNVSAVESTVAPALAQVERLQSASTRVRLWTRYALALIERPARLHQIERTIELTREALPSRSRAGRSRVSMLEGRLLAARGRYAEAVAVAERAIAESTRDPISFSASSYHYRLVSFCLRNRDVGAAQDHLEAWRHAARRSDDDLYTASLLGCAESDLALSDGRARDALELAQTTMELTEHCLSQRWRLAIRCAAIGSAIAADELEWARPVLDEILSQRDTQIAELACDVHRLDALHHLAMIRRTQPVPASMTNLAVFENEADACHYPAEFCRFGQSYRRARSCARTLDSRLRTDRHTRELVASIRSGEGVDPG
ncbi:MAG: proteasome accessory factor PafA2 family protein [Deltaproteobacteria bacterium]|nr:proteasome accessory factor PafA2 family protein [Deltaproteobacteria bacterium]MBW2362728.1 proteasome accessory factor PafA2 family protein [Deltaproteobacteria bacterium]